MGCMAAKMHHTIPCTNVVVVVVVVNHNHHTSAYGLRVGALVNFIFWLSITRILRQIGYIFIFMYDRDV